jgi:hypothetical protein
MNQDSLEFASILAVFNYFYDSDSGHNSQARSYQDEKRITECISLV